MSIVAIYPLLLPFFFFLSVNSFFCPLFLLSRAQVSPLFAAAAFGAGSLCCTSPRCRTTPEPGATALILQMWGQMCGSGTPWCSFVMHLSYNLSLYRIYMVTKGGTLMPLLVLSHLKTLLSLISCHVLVVVLEALVLALKKRGKFHMVRHKGAVRGLSFGRVWTSAGLRQPWQGSTGRDGAPALQCPGQTQQLLPQQPAPTNVVGNMVEADSGCKSGCRLGAGCTASPHSPRSP